MGVSLEKCIDSILCNWTTLHVTIWSKQSLTTEAPPPGGGGGVGSFYPLPPVVPYITFLCKEIQVKGIHSRNGNMNHHLMERTTGFCSGQSLMIRIFAETWERIISTSGNNPGTVLGMYGCCGKVAFEWLLTNSQDHAPLSSGSFKCFLISMHPSTSRNQLLRYMWYLGCKGVKE